MRKVNLLIMSGTLGLLCAGSTAVLAQSTPPSGSKTNAGETKPPFKIPDSGAFKYRGKSPQGEFREMEVEWKASGLNQKTGTTRISGDVKYKYPKTGMMDSLTIDGERSYITKIGELFFALNDGGKIFGPVDLAALEIARLAKSGESAEKKDSGSGDSATGGVPSKTQGSGLSSSSNTSLNELGVQDTQESDGSKKNYTPTRNVSSISCFSESKALDDRFKAQGSLEKEGKTFIWRQDGTHTRKDGTKGIEVFVIRNRKCISLAKNKSFLDENGYAHIWYSWLKSYIVKTAQYTKSPLLVLLERAHMKIKYENKKLGDYGLSQFKGAYRSEKGKLITTEATLLLGAVAETIGVENIANKKTQLGNRAFDSIDGLLKLEDADWVVHRMMSYLGLKVDVLPNKRRRLMERSTSNDGHQHVCYDCPNPEDIFDGALPLIGGLKQNLQNLLVQYIPDPRKFGSLNEWVIHVGLLAAQRAFNERNIGHERDLAEYLALRGALFFDRPTPEIIQNLQNVIRQLASHSRERRAGRMTARQYGVVRRLLENQMEHTLGHHMRIDPQGFIRLLVENIPALAMTEDTLRGRVREEMLRLQANRRIPVSDLYDIKSNRSDSDSDDDRKKDRAVRKNAYDLSVSLNIVAKPR